MTALVGRQVKRTFSGVVATWTGLPTQCTLKANRQNFGEFSEALVRGSLIHGVNSGCFGDRLSSPIALGEPIVDLVLEVIDDPRAAAVMWRADAVHSPLGKSGTAYTQISRSFDGSEAFSFIGFHCRSLRRR
jgi:hypothetical protein